MGGLSAACVLLVGWIMYRTFLYDPSSIDIPTGDATTAQQGGPEPKPSKDGEARFMFNRAQELDENGQPDQAIAMLNTVVKVYKETPTANEAKAALARSEKNLPLFATGPIVIAEAEKPAPARRARRRPRPSWMRHRAKVQAGNGQAALVLPANPSEAVVVPPSVRNRRRTEPGHDERSASASGVSGQSSGGNSRVGLAAGDRQRS